MRRSFRSCHAAFLLLPLTLTALAPAAQAAPARRKRPPLELLWHVEKLDGTVVDSRLGDESFNPASVVKVATTLWALETLGPDHSFETRFYARGAVDWKRKTIFGDLIVEGGGDPDFHAENGFLVAAALNKLGIERVTGNLIVNSRFWMGWENGSEQREGDPIKRALLMATRLRQGLDPKRWNYAIRSAWREYQIRHSLERTSPPRVAVINGIGADGKTNLGEMLVVHRSQPLAEILRRFNCFSNNDIERIGETIGPIDKLTDLVASHCAVPRGTVSFATTSGLGVNRMSPRLIVRLLRELKASAERLGVRVEALLPVTGCDPGTVTRFFPMLVEPPNTTSVIGKTGTLTFTDGGVAVLAGFVNTAEGEMVFCVAVPSAQGRLKYARKAEELWVVELIAKHGGARPHLCAPMLSSSDEAARIIVIAAPPSVATASAPTAKQAIR